MTNAPKEMPLLAHLAELRERLGKSVIAVIVMTCFCYYWSEQLFSILTTPFNSVSQGAEFIGTGPADAFILKIHVAIAAGIVLSSPLWFYQLWRFIAPALHEHEKRFAAPFVFFSTLFFLSGLAFCFYLVLPIAFQFFEAEYQSIKVRESIRIGEYLSFILKLMLVFGLVFEIPILSYFLARLGLLTHTWLLKQFRIAIVIIFIAAAVLTPPDVISQLLLALPLTVIYLLSVLIAYFYATKREPKTGVQP